MKIIDKYICILTVLVLLSCQYAMSDVTDTTTYNVTFSTTSCGTPVVRQFKSGNVLTIYADNDTAHIFTGWSDGVTANPRTYTVSSDTSFIAQYVAGGAGYGVMHTATVSMSGCTTSSVRQYSSVANLTITAEPEPHYHFVSWSDGNTENPRLIHVTSDTNLVASVAIDVYTVSLSGNNVSLYGSGTYSWGSQVTISAVPDANYHFVCWSDSDSSATRTFMAEENVTLTAIVEGDPFTLTTSATNGTVSGAGTYPYNSAVTLTATPDAHYHFVCWTDGDTNRVRTVTVTGNQTYVATFAIDYHTVTLLATNGVVTGAGTYNYGTEIQITATPNPHYHFVQWSDGVTTATRNITVSQNITLTAIFEGDAYNVTATTPANGSVIGGGTYPYGSSVSITAVPYSHYHFVSWNDGNTTNPRTFTLTQDTSFSATMAIDRHTVTATSQHATITGAGEYDYGTTITLSAAIDAHCSFISWSDGCTDNPRQLVVTSDTTLSLNIDVEQVQLTVAAYNGSVNGSGTYDWGTEVILTVIPDQNYVFTKWSDGDTTNPRTVTLTQNMMLTATCERTYEVKVSTSEQYTVTGTGTYIEGEVAVLTVTSLDETLEFYHWSDYNTDNPRYITVTKDVSLGVTMRAKSSSLDETVEETVTFVVAPNPTKPSDGVTVNAAGVIDEQYELSVIDGAGVTVMRYRPDAFPFTFAAPVVEGTYLIRISGEKNNAILKLIVK